jgi:hypothetical protein
MRRRRNKLKGRFSLMLGIFSIMLGCRTPYKVVSIAPSATLSEDWLELRLEKPLRWSEPVEEISFHIDSAHQISDGLEIIEANGQRCVPEVELIGDDGKSYIMDSHSFLGDEMIFSFKSHPANLKSVRAIRLHNRISLHVSNLLWRGYDPAEVKR